MKKFFAIILTLVLVISSFGILNLSAFAKSAEDTVVSIDFEDGVRTFTKGDGADITSISKENAHSGNNCLYIAPKAKNQTAQALYYDVEANTDYTVSFWFRGTPGWAVMRIRTYDKDENLINNELTEGKLCGHGDEVPNWTRFELKFNTGDCAKIGLMFAMGGTAYTFYVDDVVVKKIDPNVIAEYDFEDGVRTFTNGDGADDSASISTGNAHSGNNCLSFVPAWSNIKARSEYYDVEKNTNYKVSLWYKGTPGWAVVRIGAKDENSNIVSDYAQSEKLGTDEEITEWTYFEYVFNSGENVAIDVAFVLGSRAEFTLYVDDIVISKMDPDIVKEISFEDGKKIFSGSSSEINSNVSHTGEKSLYITPSETLKSSFYAMESNTDYTVGFWFKGTPGWAAFRVQAATDENGTGSTELDEIKFWNRSEVIDGWAYTEVSFNSGNFTYVQFRFAGSAKYPFYVDDIKLTKKQEISYDSENIFPDSSFESGSLTDWAIDSSIASISRFNPHSGSYSLIIDNGTQYARATRLVDVEPYTDYDLSFFYSGNAAWEHVVIRTTENADIHDQIQINNDDTFRTEQREFTCRFNSGNNTKLKIGFRQVAASSKNRFFYIDDICLKKADVKMNFSSAENGSVDFSGSVKGGDKVTLNVNADAGYKVKNIELAVDTDSVINQVKDDLLVATPVVDNTNSFVMPAMNVNVSAEFTELTDMNYDGNVNILDFIYLKNLISDESEITMPADDLDGSGAFDSGDLVIVVKDLLGVE